MPTTYASGIANSKRPPKNFVEHTVTRDAAVPVVEGDADFNFGWHCIPQRPPPRADDDLWSPWEIIDASSDHKTVWRRYRRFRFLSNWLSTFSEAPNA
jgi:hypothetical protein